MAKFSPEMQEQIVKYIASGQYVDTACNLAGITKRTYYNWKNRGAKGEEPYAAFLDEVEKAEAKVEARLYTWLQRAGEHDWRAARDALEKRFPKRYGTARVEQKIETRDVTGLEEMSDEEFADLLEDRAAKLRGD